MPKFRKKPVVIEAVQFVGQEVDGCRLCAQSYEPSYLEIDTLEGTMRANIGDWVITGVKGERYPCKPDIFEATYEFAG